MIISNSYNEQSIQFDADQLQILWLDLFRCSHFLHEVHICCVFLQFAYQLVYDWGFYLQKNQHFFPCSSYQLYYLDAFQAKGVLDYNKGAYHMSDKPLFMELI